ncbi:MAG: hypothetical protein JW973_16365 [Bacteroidales bacterium]|nr:hypothetical protein [Bacteroidales bacterium]
MYPLKPLFLLLVLLLTLACNSNDDHNLSGSPEIVIIDSIITTTADDHGFFNFPPPAGTGSNWKSPYDFYNGSFHYRFEVIEYPSQVPFMLNLCIWSDIEGNWERWKETCCPLIPIDGKGVFTAESIPSSWWIMDDKKVDFSRVDDFDHIGMVVWCENKKNLSDWTPASSSCWDQRDAILPLTLRLTVVAIAKDHTFSGWEKYID